MIGLALLLLTAGHPSDPTGLGEHVVVTRDQVEVHVYEFPVAGIARGAPLLMFHQAGSNARGEFAPIAARLGRAGRATFGADLRLGGSRFGSENRTSGAYRGEEGSYCDAYPDLEAALDHVHSRTNRPVVLLGSSYSGALVVRLAAMHPEKVAGFVAFSPAGGDAMRGCEAEPLLDPIGVPGLAFRNRSSAQRVAWIAESNRRWRAAGVELVELEAEGHGASLLVPERTEGPTEPAWEALDRFLRSVDQRPVPQGALGWAPADEAERGPQRQPETMR